ncbi:DMT family transporter [Mesorhizobium shangrilense]|uniref:DMT family transporter n=1 Tax=Mesorhizobium shangrilense TaxID=460060 RepID=UPI003F4927E7
MLAGAAVPFQAGTNATLGRLLGHPLWATFVSLGVSLVLIVPVMIAFRLPLPSFGMALKGPWWIWIGGAAGVVYITAALLLAPKLGAASFIVAVIAGQMMSFAHRPVNIARFAGLAFIIAGLVVTQWASAVAPATQPVSNPTQIGD